MSCKDEEQGRKGSATSEKNVNPPDVELAGNGVSERQFCFATTAFAKATVVEKREIVYQPVCDANGQQCVYDSAGKLINDGPGAGTPDRISPSPNKVINDIKSWNHGGLIRSAKHFLADGWQWLFGTEFDHWTHPPNQGKDGNGNPCPPNDGSDAPPKKCNSCK